MLPHNVRVVIDLDARRRGLKPENRGDTVKQLADPCALRQAALQRFSRVRFSMTHHVSPLAALGLQKLDLAPTPETERLRNQIELSRVAIEQDLWRRRLVVIELQEKRGEDIGSLIVIRMLGEKRPVPVITTVADKEDLKTRLSRLLPQRNDVASPMDAGLMIPDSCMLEKPRMRSRIAAARSNSSASEAFSISSTSACCTSVLLPERNCFVSSTRAAYSPGVTRSTQGAEQRRIWKSRQGRVRVESTESLQERSRKLRWIRLRVWLTAHAEANGPQ